MKGIGGKRAGGATISGRHRKGKLKVWLDGVNVTRTVRGELVVVPAPLGSCLPTMLKLVPRPRGLFAARED